MLKLEIVTPESRILDQTVDAVTVPTLSGEAGILPKHAPLVSALKPGVLSYTNKGAVERIAIAGGFVEVSDDRVSVMTDIAKTAADVDVDALKAEITEAEKALAASINQPLEVNEAERERLEKASAQMQLVSGK